MGCILRRVVDRLRAWWQPADPDDRITGSGAVYLDPAYNGRYTAERRLQEMAGDDPAEHGPVTGSGEPRETPPRRE